MMPDQRPACGPGPSAGDAAGAGADLAGVRAGALRWMRDNAAFLDSPTARAELPVTPRAKAILQLGTLCRHWSKVRPADAGLAEVTGFLDEIWPSPDFYRLMDANPRVARPFWLIYAAMAPAGRTGQLPEGVLARLTADDFLASRARSASLRLTIRYYADIAKIAHDIESYKDLYRCAPIGRYRGEHSVADLDVCDVTQTVFYLSDYSFRAAGLTRAERDLALRILGELTDYSVQRNEWELAVKLMLAQFCLGEDPVHTASGMAAITELARAQVASGAIPGRSAAQRVPESAAWLEFFRKSYQATMVTALMTLIVSGPG
jgi:hypothetical protein